MKRTKEDAEQTRRAIVTSALRVFSKQGFRETTLDHIAADAGVTRGAIYGHFRNKTDLFHCLLKELVPGYRKKVEEFLAYESSPLEKIRHLLKGMLIYPEDDEEYGAAVEVFLNADKTPEALGVLQELWEYQKLLQARVADMIRRGIQAGQIREDISSDIAALVLIKSIDGIMLGMLGDPQQYSLKEIADDVITYLLQGLMSK